MEKIPAHNHLANTQWNQDLKPARRSSESSRLSMPSSVLEGFGEDTDRQRWRHKELDSKFLTLATSNKYI